MGVIDSSVVKAFGQVAGIGGLSLLVFAWLFREVIRKRIFPQLSREHGYEVIRLFMLLVFILSLSGVAAWVYVERSKSPPQAERIVPKEDVNSAVRSWLTLIDDGRYKEAWETMPKQAQERLSKSTFIELFLAQRTPRGKVVSRVPYGSYTLSSPPGIPVGEYEARSFITQFQDGSRVLETITAMGTEEGWRVAAHNVSAPPP